MGQLSTIQSNSTFEDFQLEAKQSYNILKGPFSCIDCFETNMYYLQLHLQLTESSEAHMKTEMNLLTNMKQPCKGDKLKNVNVWDPRYILLNKEISNIVDLISSRALEMGLLFAIWSYCIIVDFRLDAKRTNSVLRGPFSRINCFETNVGHLQPTRVSCVRKKTQKNIESFSFKFDNVRSNI